MIGGGAAGLALMGLVAAGARGLPSRVLDRGDAVLNLASPAVGRIVMGGSAALVAIVLALVFWPGERASLPPRPKVSIVRTLIAMLFFAAVLSVFRVAFPEVENEEMAIEETTTTQDAEQPRWGIMLLAGALGVTLVMLIALDARSARDRTAFNAPEEPSFGQAPAVVSLAGAAVTSAHEHRRRVIALYASMLADFERRGIGRRPHEAPGEFVARVAAEPSVGEESVRRLTDLYGLAAFSTHPITAATVADAGAAASLSRHEATP